MSASREEVVAEARSWVAANTRFVHQASLKGVGSDCAGLVRGVARDAGFVPDYTPPAYGRQADPKMMRAELAKYLDPVPFAKLQVADVLWLRLITEPQHLGIVTVLEPLAMAHAWGRRGVERCVEQVLGPAWIARIDSCWRYRGLECS